MVSRVPKSQPSPIPARPRTNTLLLCALALIALVTAAYGNSLSNGFVWDDHQQIVLNGNLRPDAPLSSLFTTDARFDPHTQGLQGRDYRPLQMLTYRLLLAAFGPEPGAFHATSLLFTIACALAAFALALRLLGRWKPAFAAAALFAVFPLHTEATDWIAALPDLAYTFFLLLAFLFYLRAREARLAPDARVAARNSLLPTLLACACFLCALLWKESAVVLPLLVLAYELLVPLDRALTARLHRALKAIWPFLAVFAAYFALRLAILGGLEAGRRDWQLSPILFAVNALWLLVEYLGKLLAPIGLNAYVVFHPIRSLTDPRALAAILITVGIISAFLLLLRRASAGPIDSNSAEAAPVALPLPLPLPFLLSSSKRICFFAFSWILLSLLPALNLSALGRNAFAERYAFLASFGLCLLLVLLAQALLARLPEAPRRYAAPALLAATLLGFVSLTVLRNPDWKDDATLFSTTLAQSPDSPFLHLQVASDATSDPARAAEAEQHFRTAIDLAEAEQPPDRPDLVTASRGLAWIFANRGQLPQALTTLDTASALDPTNPDTLGERGLILLRAGQPAAAAPLLEQALAADPGNENVLSALGLLTRESAHNPAAAVAYFQRALAAHAAQDDFAASQHNNLAAAYADLGNWPAAIEQEREAIRILPSDPEFHVNLAGALASTGHREEARAEAMTALQLSPNDPAALSLLNALGGVTQ